MLPLIGLGAHVDPNSKGILWENGPGKIPSDLVSFQDLYNTFSNQIYINITAPNSTRLANSNSSTSSLIFCHGPLVSSYCIDLPSLISALAKNGEAFMANPLEADPTQGMSSFSCVQFCYFKNAAVSIWMVTL